MEEILEHHGIIGQKWGVRRFQNKDGSLTSLGKKRAEQRTAAAQKQDAAKKYQEERNALVGRINAVKAAAEEDEEKKKARAQLQALMQSLADEFDETISAKYVKFNIDKNDPRNSTITYVSPVDGSKSTFTLSNSGSISSKLRNDLKTAESALKRTDAAVKQDQAKQIASIKQKNKEKEKDLAAKRTTVAQKQDSAKKDAESKIADQKRISSESKIKMYNRDLKEADRTIKNIQQKISDTNRRLTKYNGPDKAMMGPFIKGAEETMAKLQKQLGEAKNYRNQLKKKLKDVSHGENTDDILIHYGILGQKWGIRRYQNEDGTLTDAEKARVNKKYSKGVEKLKKYDTKIQKLNTKKNKLDEKARKQDYKTNRPKRLLETWGGYERRMAKSDSKLRKAENKYRKADWKSEKMYNKGAKWVEKMSKKFSNIDLSSVNQSDINYVNDYLSSITADKRRPSHDSERRSSGRSSRSTR